MASDHQVALTRAQRLPTTSTHISKAARQVIPAFLQKLYELGNIVGVSGVYLTYVRVEWLTIPVMPT